MKLSVCGKGGSGKSTVTALLAGAAQRKGFRVLVVDADESNSGLYRLLGFEAPPVSIMESLGGKKGVKEKMGQPAIFSEATIPIDAIPSPYTVRRDGLLLASIGKILQSLEGCACPMGVLSREFLKKLSLGKGDIVIADMEAGIEHFGRGVETSLDSVLVVVEPSFESLELSARIKDLAQGSGIENVRAVLNKVPSPETAAKMNEELARRGLAVAGVIPSDDHIFAAGLAGISIGENVATESVAALLDNILEANEGK